MAERDPAGLRAGGVEFGEFVAVRPLCGAVAVAVVELSHDERGEECDGREHDDRCEREDRVEDEHAREVWASVGRPGGGRVTEVSGEFDGRGERATNAEGDRVAAGEQPAGEQQPSGPARFQGGPHRQRRS